MFQQSRWNSRIVRGSQCVATLEIVPIRIIPDCGPIRLCSRSVTCHSRHVPDHAADAALRVVQCLGCRVIPPYSAVHTNTRYLSALFSRLSDPPSILFLDTVATSSRFSHVSSVCTLDLDRWCCAAAKSWQRHTACPVRADGTETPGAGQHAPFSQRCAARRHPREIWTGEPGTNERSQTKREELF